MPPGSCRGRRTVPCSRAKGRREAAARRRAISVTSTSPPSTRSDLERARETAAIIGRALRVPLQYDPALRERNFGDAQGHPLERAATRRRRGSTGDRVVDADARPPEGESLRELYERVGAFIDAVETQATGGRRPRRHPRRRHPGRRGLLQRRRRRGHGLGPGPQRKRVGPEPAPTRPNPSRSRAVESRARSVSCDQRCCSYHRGPASRGPRA